MQEGTTVQEMGREGGPRWVRLALRSNAMGLGGRSEMRGFHTDDAASKF